MGQRVGNKGGKRVERGTEGPERDDRGKGDRATEQQKETETPRRAARQPRAEGPPAHRPTAPGPATVWLHANSGAPRSGAGCTAPGAAAPHTSWTPRGTWCWPRPRWAMSGTTYVW